MTEPTPKRLGDAIAAKRALHQHAYGPPAERGSVRHCIAGDGCVHLNVVDRRTGQWRDLTVDEQINVTAQMMEDICIAQAMQIVHGPERGLARARQLLGYDG